MMDNKKISRRNS